MSEGGKVSVTEEVAKFALAEARIPDEVHRLATNHLIDGFAVMLAGATEESGALVRDHVRELGGHEQATIVATSLRAPAQTAAFANGVAAHAFDYDDTQLATDPKSVYGLLTHPTTPSLAGALAVAEALDTSGKAMFEAYILGWRSSAALPTRLPHVTTRRASTPPPQWASSPPPRPGQGSTAATWKRRCAPSAWPRA